MYVYVCVCVCVYIYIYIHTHAYIHTYIHTHIHTNNYFLGNTVTFDELPLTIAVYTTSHVVGDVVYTVLYSGGSFLEMALYVNLEVVISPDDGHFIWDNNTSEYRVIEFQ